MRKNNLRAPRPRERRPGHIYSPEAHIIEDASSSQSSVAQKVRSGIQSVKDSSKVFHEDIDRAVRERINRMHSHFPLPKSIDTFVDPHISDCILINRDYRSRELLPDIPDRHVILCHGSLARRISSGVGIFARITQAGDGSWALVPASLKMLNATTVQHVRRRRFWFLRRYSYEISFDGHVQPAMMLFDYGLDPTRQRQRLWVSREDVAIRDSDKYNTFFRFWLDRKNIIK